MGVRGRVARSGMPAEKVNIQWDIDPEDDDGVELPNEITIPNDIEYEEAISDYISDVTGFCHKGFELEEQL